MLKRTFFRLSRAALSFLPASSISIHKHLSESLPKAKENPDFAHVLLPRQKHSFINWSQILTADWPEFSPPPGCLLGAGKLRAEIAFFCLFSLFPYLRPLGFRNKMSWRQIESWEMGAEKLLITFRRNWSTSQWQNLFCEQSAWRRKWAKCAKILSFTMGENVNNRLLPPKWNVRLDDRHSQFVDGKH